MTKINQPLFETKAVSKATDQLMSTQTEQTITSLEVAELTGKQHAHIMRDIRNLLDQGVAQSNFGCMSYKSALADIRNILSQNDEIGRLNFQETSYTSDRGKEYPMFNLTKEGCLCLVSGLKY